MTLGKRRRIVLVGLPGAGKSEVSRLLARRLGLRAVDTDEMVTESTGMTPAQIFEDSGEPRFRELESTELRKAVSSQGTVVASGGGVLESEENRRLIQNAATVVYLRVDAGTAASRLAESDDRPLIASGDAEARLQALLVERRAGYEAAADLAVDASPPAATVADEVGRLLDIREQTVPLPGGGYQVLSGPGALDDLATLIKGVGEGRAVVAVDANVLALHRERLELALESVPALSWTGIPSGETSKSVELAAELLEKLAVQQVRRDDLMVAVGGGVTTDIAGFVASIYHRGMRVAHIPTTLVGMADAAIGGKTAINLPSGKNLAGTFHQPDFVIADTRFLRTLPGRELRSGMAELIKYALCFDPSMITLLRNGVAPGDLAELIGKSISIKAEVVADDERDTGRRTFLNYGHTLGHALERATRYRVLHGEAVAVGMQFAAELAVVRGLLSEGDAQLHEELIRAAGLSLKTEVRLHDVLPLTSLDKKHRDTARWILLDGIGNPVVASDVAVSDLDLAVKRLDKRLGDSL